MRIVQYLTSKPNQTKYLEPFYGHFPSPFALLTHHYSAMFSCTSEVTLFRRLRIDDHYHNYIGVTEDINKAIKATARTITKSRLSDKIRSEVLLQKAGLRCLNEAVASIAAVTVWKSKTFMDPLGQRIFRENPSFQCTIMSVRLWNFKDGGS